MSVDLWVKLASVILLTQCFVAFYFLLWLHRAIPNQVLKKYSVSQRISGMLSIGENWKTRIEKDDLVFFYRARKGFMRVIFFLIVSLGVQAALLAAVINE